MRVLFLAAHLKDGPRPANSWSKSKEKVKALVAQLCPIHRDPMDCSLPGSCLHWTLQPRIRSGLPFPSPEELPDQEHGSPALQADSLPSKPPGKPKPRCLPVPAAQSCVLWLVGQLCSGELSQNLPLLFLLQQFAPLPSHFWHFPSLLQNSSTSDYTRNYLLYLQTIDVWKILLPLSEFQGLGNNTKEK